MRFHYNTSTTEFLDWLRYSGIDGGMPPQFIDCVDRLYELDGKEAEIEKLGDELYEMKESRDDLREELNALITVLDENLPENAGASIEKALKIARLAIERHSG